MEQSLLIAYQSVAPTAYQQSIIVANSPEIRALTVGSIQSGQFVPARLTFGTKRKTVTAKATAQSLQLPAIRGILKKYSPDQISTVTVLRETLACQMDLALASIGLETYYGDAFIGATHIKGDGAIKTAYLYENIEGLTPKGLWIIADSICVGRNLIATLESLLQKQKPQEILFLCPLISRLGANNIGKILANHNIPTTFIGWGAIFGVDEKTLYDMPWGHKDTEPLDPRDQKTFIDMYGPDLCVGGDFGNNYYSPTEAKKLYNLQLKEHNITPKIPAKEILLTVYKPHELLTFDL